jgi:glycine oxidase
MDFAAVKFDLVIVGAGAVGLSIAWESAGRGLRTALVDQRKVAAGASWAGAGILPPGAKKNVRDPLELLRAESHRLFADWCDHLVAETAIDPGFLRCGGIYLGRTPAEKAVLLAQESWWSDHGIEYQRLDHEELDRRVGGLADASRESSSVNAWFLPDECQVRNPRYLKALSVAARKRGVQIFEDEKLVNIEDMGNGLEIRTDSSRYASRQVCLATGAWTSLLGESTEFTAEIYPVRGQMILFKLANRTFEPIINEGHRYLVPRSDGYVLAGSCEEEVGFDERTTDEMIGELSNWAHQTLPSLRSAVVEKQWAGLRPATVDGLPYLGEIPKRPNIFVAAGHYRHGIHFSPITAVCMVDLMTGLQPPIDLAPFRMTRGKTYSH